MLNNNAERQVAAIIEQIKAEGLTPKLSQEAGILMAEINQVIEEGKREYGDPQSPSTPESRAYESAVIAEQDLASALGQAEEADHLIEEQFAEA